ncbi:MAG: hypothetical protein ACO28M_05060 [Vulcanococcus sp.]
MQTALLLAFLLPIPFFGRGLLERTDQAAWSQLVEAVDRRGIAVIKGHERCRERDLYGLYVRRSRQVVVCPRGDQSVTLRHEGWHAVQSLCLADGPWLTPEQIEQKLNRADRAELRSLVSRERWQREAEARAMAHLKPADYLQELERACSS